MAIGSVFPWRVVKTSPSFRSGRYLTPDTTWLESVSIEEADELADLNAASDGRKAVIAEVVSSVSVKLFLAARPAKVLVCPVALAVDDSD
jgi:hypothetical protein